MIFYLVILLMTALLALPFGKMRFGSSERALYLALVAAFLAFVLAFRETTVGTDTVNYVSAFNTIRGQSFLGFLSSRYEPLFFILNWVAALFSKAPHLVFFVEGVATIGLMMRFIGKHSHSPLVSVLLFQEAYFYCATFNVSRAWLAFSIALIGYDFAKERKLIPALAFVVLGMMFHTSSMLFAVVFFFVAYRDKITDALVIVIGGIALFASLFAKQLAGVVVYFLPRYEYYLTNSGGESGGTLFPAFLIALVLVGLIMIQRNRCSQQGDELAELRVLALALLFGAACLLMVHSFPVAVRMAPVFTVFILLYVPLVGRCSKYGWILLIGSVILMLVYYFTLLRAGNAGVIPYETWLLTLY